ncbi:hypothetical protein SAMN05216267_100227 [Actinacidiphila rubida]|uniref:Uncharacterized protein n=1 Tax=Actinacidiphila rubida TaxID=310780 RepID=A0A1H8E5W1_9ACTN|nr:hypothetical protein [Actinacidiphila rubida]SEN14800.1 hypothetical protein SAMN05216267_100227 [Actinacidiphila rubida]
MPEPAPRAVPEAAPERDRSGDAAGRHADVPPYHVRVEYADGQWHLAVDSLNDHPDRGEVDSVVVTVAARRPDDGPPPSEIDATLRGCGFDRHGEWEHQGGTWSAPCAQSDAKAAPAAPPPDAEPRPTR